MTSIGHEAALGHCDNAGAFLALNRSTARFGARGVDGFVPYIAAGRRHVLALFGPIAAPEDQSILWEKFERHCRDEQRAVIVIQASRPFGGELANRGYVVNQVGAAFSARLTDMTFSGKRFKGVRNNVAAASRAGVEVTELEHDDHERYRAIFDSIDRAWLRAKGPGTRQLRFMVGDRWHQDQPMRRIFLLTQHGEPIGYSTFVPAPRTAGPGYLWDLTRRVDGAARGVNELLVHTAARAFRDEGHEWLHLGLTPFVDLRAEWEFDGHSSLLRRFGDLLASHGGKLYPAQNNLRFKRKWQPERVYPEYIAFEQGPSMRAVWGILRTLGLLP